MKLWGAACAAVWVGLAGHAHAAGYAIREQSAVGQGASFAGSAARGDDPSFLPFNPAAMAWRSGTEVVNVGSGIFPQSEAERVSGSRARALGGSPIAGSDGGDAALSAFVPAFHATTGLSEQWRIGLSVTAPFGLVTKYNDDFVGRYHALTSSLKTINIAPAISWRPLPNFAIGAALQIQYADARLSNAFDFGAVGFANPATRPLGFRPGSADGRSTLAGDDTAIGWRIGAQWEPLDGTRLGVSFNSAIFHDLDGDVRFEGVPRVLRPAFRDGQIKAKLTTPESLGLGVTQRLGERWTLLAGAEWTNWSRFRDIVVRFEDGRAPSVTEENWRDTWFLSLGAEYRATETLTLRGGFAWDTSAVPDSTRTPRIADTDRYWLSIGVTWQARPNMALSAGYTHIFTGDAPVSLRDDGPGTVNFLRGNFAADYRGSVDILAVQARLSF